MTEETRLDELKRKLAARQGSPAFKTNRAALRKEIARLEKEQTNDQS